MLGWIIGFALGTKSLNERYIGWTLITTWIAWITWKLLEELDGHQISTYNVWKVHQIEEIEERGYISKYSSLNFKNSQKKTTKQGPYLIKGRIVKKVSSLFS